MMADSNSFAVASLRPVAKDSTRRVWTSGGQWRLGMGTRSRPAGS